MNIMRLWLWDRSGFTLATCVLAGLISGWVLPEISLALALAQIAMAIVVVIKEGQAMSVKK